MSAIRTVLTLGFSGTGQTDGALRLPCRHVGRVEHGFGPGSAAIRTDCRGAHVELVATEMRLRDVAGCLLQHSSVCSDETGQVTLAGLWSWAPFVWRGRFRIEAFSEIHKRAVSATSGI